MGRSPPCVPVRAVIWVNCGKRDGGFVESRVLCFQNFVWAFLIHSFVHWAHPSIHVRWRNCSEEQNRVGYEGSQGAGREGTLNAFHRYLPGELLFILQDFAPSRLLLRASGSTVGCSVTLTARPSTRLWLSGASALLSSPLHPPWVLSGCLATGAWIKADLSSATVAARSVARPPPPCRRAASRTRPSVRRRLLLSRVNKKLPTVIYPVSINRNFYRRDKNRSPPSLPPISSAL